MTMTAQMHFKARDGETYANHMKPVPTESSSESDVSYRPTYHENTERGVTPHRRKYGKKMSNKKTSKETRKRKNITWEPLCFDSDDTDKIMSNFKRL